MAICAPTVELFADVFRKKEPAHRELQDEPPNVPNGEHLPPEIIPKKEIISDAILWTPLFTVFFELFRVRPRDPPFLIYEGKTEVG